MQNLQRDALSPNLIVSRRFSAVFYLFRPPLFFRHFVTNLGRQDFLEFSQLGRRILCLPGACFIRKRDTDIYVPARKSKPENHNEF